MISLIGIKRQSKRDMPPTLNADEPSLPGGSSGRSAWPVRLASNADRTAGCAAIARMLEQFLTPAVPWRSVLADTCECGRAMILTIRDPADVRRSDPAGAAALKLT